MDKKIWRYSYDIGEISITDDGIGISEVSFKNKDCFNDYIEEETALILETSKQLREYFKGKRKNFDVPLSMKGTEFQNKVWDALKLIPYGKTQTYKEIAEKINSPKACRAVGLANNKNPICIIIPCHRVVGSNNSLVGYAFGLHVKKYLLDLEKRNI
ncbi:MAG: methylated-DNA--[protein]-cysteine S-methyltransferase [Oscillospiraceae bacterium]|jgi:methylated-DNA-[protein]-cysteine S-methyltransferase|nr:methylated-DNA--[protein]-cysteine S-methyltransferase [Oscillospiraceae bacterium]